MPCDEPANWTGSYPGAGAAKLQAEHATAQTTVSELEAKCNQAQETLHKLKMDRGLCEGQDQVSGNQVTVRLHDS